MDTLSIFNLTEQIDYTEQNPQDAPDEKPEDTRKKINESLPHDRIKGLFVDQNGRPVAYKPDELSPRVRVTFGENGFILCGDDIIAHWDEVGYIRPSMEVPKELTSYIKESITRYLADTNSVFVYQNCIYEAKQNQNGTHKLIPIESFPSFDSLLQSYVSFFSVKVTNTSIFYKQTPLPERMVANLRNYVLSSDLIPKIEIINEVSTPYFPLNSKTPKFNPVGYNYESRTYTTNVCQPIDIESAESIRNWHKERLSTFLWKTPEDYTRYVMQTLTHYVMDMLIPIKPDGSRGVLPVVPASLISSTSIEGAAGKSTLTQLAAVATNGIVSAAPTPNKDELHNQQVIAIAEGRKCMFIDEGHRLPLDTILTAITDETNGRIKGVSRNVRGKLHYMVAATSPKLSKMLSRRILNVSVISHKDYLTRKVDFITKPVIEELRQTMIAFCKALVDTWIEKGCKLSKPNSMWPEFSSLVGGIMEANGYFTEDEFESTVTTAISLDEEENEHEENEFENYFKLVANGTLSWMVNGNEIPIVGIHKASDILAYAQSADYMTHLDTRNAYATRSFMKNIRPYVSGNKPLHGYSMSRLIKNDGAYIKIVKITVDKDQH